MQLLGSTHFTARFLLPIVAATGITIAALAGFLAWSAERIDQDALVRDRLLLERALQELENRLYLAQEELAVWDEAVDAVAAEDRDWLVENLGVWAYGAYGHSRTLVLSAAGEPIIALRDGGSVRSKAAAEAVGDLALLLADLVTLDTEARISAYNAGVSDEPPQAMDFMTFEGRPALVAIMPVLSFSGENAPPVGEEARYVSAIFLDDAVATELGDQYRIAAPHFTTTEPPAGTEAVLAVRDRKGSPVAWLTWQADRSGTRLLQTATPALLSALVIAVIIVGLLLRSLHSTMTALQAQREEASHLAHHDPLTGLGNRSLFRAKLEEGIRSMSAGEPRLAVLALDLDNFKQVNDTMGHQAGDELLTAVAGRLRGLMREEDTLIRFGGDEFAVIMPGITTHEEPRALAQAIIDSLSRPVALAAGTASIGVSIGIATAPDLAHGEMELMRFADDALYRAKNGGRNRYCLYGAEVQSEPAQHQARLREAFAPRVVGETG